MFQLAGDTLPERKPIPKDAIALALDAMVSKIKIYRAGDRGAQYTELVSSLSEKLYSAHLARLNRTVTPPGWDAAEWRVAVHSTEQLELARSSCEVNAGKLIKNQFKKQDQWEVARQCAIAMQGPYHPQEKLDVCFQVVQLLWLYRVPTHDMEPEEKERSFEQRAIAKGRARKLLAELQNQKPRITQSAIEAGERRTRVIGELGQSKNIVLLKGSSSMLAYLQTRDLKDFKTGTPQRGASGYWLAVTVKSQSDYEALLKLVDNPMPKADLFSSFWPQKIQGLAL